MDMDENNVGALAVGAFRLLSCRVEELAECIDKANLDLVELEALINEVEGQKRACNKLLKALRQRVGTTHMASEIATVLNES